MTIGVFPRCPVFLLLLCYWPSSTTGLGVSWKSPVNNSSSVRQSTAWALLRQSALSSRDFTRRGQRIPGLAKHSKCCGIVNHVSVNSSGGEKIVNGTATTRDEFPWTAALIPENSDIFVQLPFCGGFLINNRYVMTAAHCVAWWPSPRFAGVVLRKYEMFETSPQELRLAVDAVIVHPRYRESSLGDNDIALLKLATVLDFPFADNRIAPICLPSRSLFINAEAELAGYGITMFMGDPLVDRPSQLNSVKMRIVSNGVCAYLNTLLLPDYVVRASSVCAIGTVGGTGVCQGDSGSPLMVKARYRRTRMVAVGIASWAIGCAGPLDPSVYARVTTYLDWIVTNTQDATYC